MIDKASKAKPAGMEKPPSKDLASITTRLTRLESESKRLRTREKQLTSQLESLQKKLFPKDIVHTLPNGTIVHTKPDGTKLFAMPDGTLRDEQGNFVKNKKIELKQTFFPERGDK